MTSATVLVATWSDGLSVFAGESRQQELAGQPVRSLTSDGRGGALAIVDGHSLCRRGSDGTWSTIATSAEDLSCCVAVGDDVFIGTDTARMLRVSAEGSIEALEGFDSMPGRDSWYAGQALINGQMMGPPLGVRSIAATCDGAVLLANVHVGGIPRSTDGGLTWQPTLAVDNDVHEVCTHPTQPESVIAAAATGLCISRDGGAGWTVEQEGLHALYCSAVAFAGDDILVAASADHFAAEGAVYRRALDGHGPLQPVGAGFPRWIDGIADTACIASRASALALADKAGNLYVSADAGQSWSQLADGLPSSSSVLII
jgi:hypothetical protein